MMPSLMSPDHQMQARWWLPCNQGLCVLMDWMWVSKLNLSQDKKEANGSTTWVNDV